MLPIATVLPRPAPLPVLALGAYLKNTACRLDGALATGSAVHGDLGEVAACLALEASARRLSGLQHGAAPLQALAHDAHPDFHSTRLAQALADEAGVPAWAVQHHRAHVAVVQAEAGPHGPVLGLALDGVGLGSDGTAWGGELLWADDPARSSRWRRLAHLPTLALPGGDRAAREPWRLAAAVLHGLGRGDEIVARMAGASPSASDPGGSAAAGTVATLLARGLQCPPTTAAGRWFDAAAAALGLHTGPQAEAEAAIALERAAAAWLQQHDEPELDIALAELPALVGALFDLPPARRGEGAARFHLGLASALARATEHHAQALDVGSVVLCGGCFHNRLLTAMLATRLARAGLHVCHAAEAGCGDAGLALGQAWLASWAQARHDDPLSLLRPLPDPVEET